MTRNSGIMSLNHNGFSGGYPICAESPLIQRGGFRDIDEQAAQLAGHDQIYQQIGPGAFCGRFLTADLGRSSYLFIEQTSQALLQAGSVPAGQTSFMFLLGEQQHCHFQGAEFTSADLAVLPSSSSFSARCPANTDFCVITLDQELVDAMPWPNAPAGAFRLRASQIALIVGALRYLVRTSLSLFEEAPGAPAAGTTLSSLRQSLAATLGLALSTHCDRSGESGRKLTAHARALVDRNLREIDVAALCAMLGTPRRTLEVAFQQELGIGPSRYIKTLRLNHIRRELLAAPRSPIADIAASWGLWHPSHFAESYVALFHERPSETRQRARS
jgi:AraC family ethanolamine operon transcriptional activator